MLQGPSACVGGSADGSLLTQTHVDRVLSLKNRGAIEEALDKLKDVPELTQPAFEKMVRQVLVVGVSFPDLLDILIAGLEKVSESPLAIMYLHGFEEPGTPHVPVGFVRFLKSHSEKACPKHPKRGLVILALALLVACCWTKRSSDFPEDGQASASSSLSGNAGESQGHAADARLEVRFLEKTALF